ncbi:MAG TPA: hypothetical protein PKD10_18140 [Paracoccaceae bacterium]|nr:hypothetical protein [Paracoccaceae bacterium]HMO70670.1 hypothetical protein [Paracoccaceae bacterium]
MLRRAMFPVLLAAVLAACQPQGAGPGAAPPGDTGTIEVTTLDAPGAAPALAEPPASAAPPGEGTDPPPAPEAAPEAAPELPAALLSPEAQACQRRGGRWVRAGGALMACVRPTQEGMKSCTRGTDCRGECLARSGTCAPFAPLFGCNEVLDDMGRRVTLCLD